jgi:hypothetical protein
MNRKAVSKLLLPHVFVYLFGVLESGVVFIPVRVRVICSLVILVGFLNADRGWEVCSVCVWFT